MAPNKVASRHAPLKVIKVKALGKKRKRDRRTVEEIQEGLKKKRFIRAVTAATEAVRQLLGGEEAQAQASMALQTLEKHQVDVTLLRETGAGRVVGRLARQQHSSGVSNQASLLLARWKEIAFAAESVAKESREKRKQRPRLAHSSTLPSQKLHRQRSNRKQLPSQAVGGGCSLARGTGHSSKLSQMPKSTEPVSDDEWERAYLARCRGGGKRVREEEEFSRAIGELEDRNALL